MNQRMDGFNVGDMDPKKFPFQGQMNPKQMQPNSVQNAMPQQQDMQQFSFFPQAVSMMSQAGIPQMQFSASSGMPNGNFRMAQNPSNLQQFPSQQQQQQANLMANMGMNNQGLVPQLSQAAQMTSPPSANSIISFPHLSQLQQSASSNKNIHDEVINASNGQNVDQSASSQDNNGNTPNGLANPQSPAPVSGNNAQVSSPNSGSGSNNNMSTAITPASPGVVRSLAPGGAKATYIDITPYLNMPQKEAARRLGIPTSTLSKRWKEAVRCRKWPYRTICKLDKEIMALLQNIPQDYNTRTNQLPEEIETTLGYLLRKRQEELQPVIIRV